MDFFLQGLEQQIAEEKGQSKRHDSGIQEKWNGRKIPFEDRQKFAQYFEKSDLKNEGSLNVELGMKLFARSGLDSQVITRIWTLADVNQDQRVDKEEFIIAMYLIQCSLKGEELPEILPESLAPVREKKIAPYTSIPFPPPDYQPSIGRENSGILQRDVLKSKLSKSQELVGPKLKLTILGDQCGKSSLISRFLFDEFSELEESTVEENYEFNHEYNHLHYHLSILDTSGNETFMESMISKWFMGTDGFLLVFSISAKFTFQALEPIRLKIMNYFKDDRLPIVVVGTKCDQESQRQVPTQVAKDWASKHGFGYIETSARTGHNISQTFELLIDKIEQNKEKGILVLQNPHKWKKTSFTTPVTCKRCNTLIWGIAFKYGYTCEVCKDSVHKKCKDLVRYNCGTKSAISTKKSGSLADIISNVTDEEFLFTLQSSELSGEFYKYLEKKGGKTLLEFWHLVEEFRNITDHAQRIEKGSMIYNTFFFNIEKDNKFNFKLPDKVIKKLKKKFEAKDFHPNMFAEAQYYVYHQLERDVFPSYVKNTLLRDNLFNVDQTKENIRQIPHDWKDPNNPPQNISSQNSFDEGLTFGKPITISRKNSVLSSDTKPYSKISEVSRPLSEDSGWYFSNLPRINAEQLLMAAGPSTFLLRNSSIQGCYALSLYTRSGFIHWMITPRENGVGLQDCEEDKNVYPNVYDLVAKTPILENFTASGTGQKRSELF